MIRSIFIASILSLLFITSCGVKKNPNASLIVNKKCVVMTDHDVDPEVTLVYEGKVYGFCCEKCPPKFKADPKKYLAQFEAGQKSSAH